MWWRISMRQTFTGSTIRKRNKKNAKYTNIHTCYIHTYNKRGSRPRSLAYGPWTNPLPAARTPEKKQKKNREINLGIISSQKNEPLFFQNQRITIKPRVHIFCFDRLNDLPIWSSKMGLFLSNILMGFKIQCLADFFYLATFCFFG